MGWRDTRAIIDRIVGKTRPVADNEVGVREIPAMVPSIAKYSLGLPPEEEPLVPMLSEDLVPVCVGTEVPWVLALNVPDVKSP